MAFGKLNFKFTWKCREHFTLLSLASAFAIYILSSITRSSSHRCQIQSTHERENIFMAFTYVYSPLTRSVHSVELHELLCRLKWHQLKIPILLVVLLLLCMVYISAFIFITSTYRSAAHLIVKSISLLFCNIASADVLCVWERERDHLRKYRIYDDILLATVMSSLLSLLSSSRRRKSHYPLDSSHKDALAFVSIRNVVIDVTHVSHPTLSSLVSFIQGVRTNLNFPFQSVHP